MTAKRGEARRQPRKQPAEAESVQLDRHAVRHWRLQRGFTQQALSEQRISIDGHGQSLSYSLIRRIESDGFCGPTSARVLAVLLGVELAQLSPRDHRQLPCGLPREPSIDFVGREAEIKSVLAALAERGSVRVAASIEGLPGIGKTELALQVCGLCERERRFRIFWFEAEQPDLTSTWADVVAPHLGIEDAKPERRAQRALQAVEALAEPVLIVLDNVEQWSARQPCPRPRGRHIHWLVTTRSHQLGAREFHHVTVPLLDARSAEALMVKIAGPEVIARAGFAALMAELGGYTISLELAASFLHRFPEVEPAEYLEQIRSGRGDELENEVEQFALYGKTLESALELLWERLPDHVRACWQLAARFAPAPVSSELSDACGLDRRARAQLRDFHLIQSHSGRQWSMHRLVRAFALTAGTSEDRTRARERFFAGCVTRARGMNESTGLEILSPDRAHFEIAIRFPPSDGISPESLALLHGCVGKALCSLGEYRSARSLLDSARREAAAALGPRALATLELDRVRGWARYESGDPSVAREIYELALQGLEDEDDRWRVLAAELHNELGIVCTSLGEWSQARASLESALEVSARICGPQGEVCLAEARNSLGGLLQQMGAFETAQGHYEQALQHALSALGEAHPRTAVRRNNLAGLLMQRGELDEARRLYQQALDGSLASLGDRHPTVALRRCNLACVLRDLGELDSSIELFEAALEAASPALGADHPLIAAIRSRYGVALRERGQVDRGLTELEASLEWSRKHLRDDHYNIACDLSELAATHHAAGNLPRAMELARETIEIWERRGEPHGCAFSARATLSRALRDSGDLSGARQLLEHSLERIRSGEAPLRRVESHIRSDLGWLLRELGSLSEAAEHLQAALALEVELRQEHRARFAILQARLAAVLHARGDHTGARSWAERAWKKAQQMPGGWIHRAEIEPIARAVLGDAAGA